MIEWLPINSNNIQLIGWGRMRKRKGGGRGTGSVFILYKDL
jgi:hypothetical protein